MIHAKKRLLQISRLDCTNAQLIDLLLDIGSLWTIGKQGNIQSSFNA